MIGLIILLAAIVGISAFVAILLVDNANTAAKINKLKEELNCEVWNNQLNQCASDELTAIYKKYHKGVNTQ